MEGVKKVAVNGREYTVVMLNPSTAFEFCHAYINARTTGKNMNGMGRTAIGQCRDHMMRALSDEANFQMCFSEHPEDMFALEVAALDALVEPYMPKQAVKE